MKRVRTSLLFLILFISLSSLSASISPYSMSIGRVYTGKAGTELAIKDGFEKEYSDAWLEEYSVNTPLFILNYTPLLSSLLPMDNVIVSEKVGYEIKLTSLSGGPIITVIVNSDDKIEAISSSN